MRVPVTGASGMLGQGLAAALRPWPAAFDAFLSTLAFPARPR